MGELDRGGPMSAPVGFRRHPLFLRREDRDVETDMAYMVGGLCKQKPLGGGPILPSVILCGVPRMSAVFADGRRS